jgi:hypothetical protein
MPTCLDPRGAVAELEQRLRDDDTALFVRDGGFLIAENNRSAFVAACVIIHFYCEKPRTLVDLLRECIRFARAAGMVRFHGVDINFLPQRGYRRLLGGLARRAVQLGVMYELEA